MTRFAILRLKWESETTMSRELEKRLATLGERWIAVSISADRDELIVLVREN